MKQGKRELTADSYYIIRQDMDAIIDTILYAAKQNMANGPCVVSVQSRTARRGIVTRQYTPTDSPRASDFILPRSGAGNRSAGTRREVKKMETKTDCTHCPFGKICPIVEKSQRLPLDDGGLGLCPKLPEMKLLRCRNCIFAANPKALEAPANMPWKTDIPFTSVRRCITSA